MSASSPEASKENQIASQPAEAELTDVVQSGNASRPRQAGTMRAGEAGSVDSNDNRRWHIEEGTDVIGTCGHKIGEVMDVQDEYVVVEKGFFITCDLYVPKSAIAGHDKDGLHLNVTKHDADEWDSDPRNP